MDKYHETNPPTELKSVVLGRQNSAKNKKQKRISDQDRIDHLEKYLSYPENTLSPPSGLDGLWEMVRVGKIQWVDSSGSTLRDCIDDDIKADW